MANRAKKQDDEGKNGPPKTQREIFDEHYSPIKAAQLAMEKDAETAKKSRSAYQSSLKAYKKAGGDNDAMTQALRMAKRDPKELAIEFTNINNHLLWMNIPVGHQLGLFPDGESVGAKVDAGKIDEQSGKEGSGQVGADPYEAAHQAGWTVGYSGFDSSNNPHKAGSSEHQRWTLGWQEGAALKESEQTESETAEA
jgi:hypothetical protein